MKKNSKKVIASLLLILILASPIITYINNFGYSLSPSHQKWSEFGAIMSGIYSPLIAFVALLFLFNQLRSQLSIDKHQHDSAIIERSRHDIDFYIDKLELYLERKHEEDVTIKQYLNSNFSNLKISLTRHPSQQSKIIAY